MENSKFAKFPYICWNCLLLQSWKSSQNDMVTIYVLKMKFSILLSTQLYLFSPFSGIPSTINSANYVMFICLERVLDLGHPDAVKVFCEQMLELHRGQAQWSEIENSIWKFNGSNLELVLKELYNLAAILQHYAGSLIFMK